MELNLSAQHIANIINVFRQSGSYATTSILRWAGYYLIKTEFGYVLMGSRHHPQDFIQRFGVEIIYFDEENFNVQVDINSNSDFLKEALKQIANYES